MTDIVHHDAAQSKSVGIVRLPLAAMGKGDSFVRRQVAMFRQSIERAVVERVGNVGVSQASRIHTAAVALRRHLQCERRLAREGGTLSVSDWVALSDRTVKHKETVDRCLAALGLDAEAKPPDPWSIIYGANASAPAAPGPPAASETTHGPSADADAAMGR